MLNALLNPITFLSIVGNVVLALLIIIVWTMAPRTAKYLIKKKLMLMQNKTLNLVAYGDRYMQMEALEVSSEGLLESKGKKGITKNYYLAKPVPATANPETNLQDKERETDILPPYSLEGIPTYFSHSTRAVATNPRVLTALRVQCQADPENPRHFKRDLAVVKEGVKQNVEVNVHLPFDPFDITKHISKYWDTSMIQETKQRNRNIGIALIQAKNNDTLKIMIIGAIVAVAIIAGAVVALKLV